MVSLARRIAARSKPRVASVVTRLFILWCWLTLVCLPHLLVIVSSVAVYYRNTLEAGDNFVRSCFEDFNQARLRRLKGVRPDGV